MNDESIFSYDIAEMDAAFARVRLRKEEPLGDSEYFMDLSANDCADESQGEDE